MPSAQTALAGKHLKPEVTGWIAAGEENETDPEGGTGTCKTRSQRGAAVTTDRIESPIAAGAPGRLPQRRLMPDACSPAL